MKRTLNISSGFIWLVVAVTGLVHLTAQHVTAQDTPAVHHVLSDYTLSSSTVSDCNHGCSTTISSPVCSPGSSCSCQRVRRCEPLWQRDIEYFQYEPAPLPLGSSFRQIFATQKHNGQLAQLVLYRFHFQFDSSTYRWSLSPAGIGQISRIIEISQQTNGPITVEATGDVPSDQARLQVAMDALAYAGCHNADVRIGSPRANGISGPEASSIVRARLGVDASGQLGVSGQSVPVNGIPTSNTLGVSGISSGQ